MDTNYLYDYLDNVDHPSDTTRQASQVVNKALSNKVTIKISVLAVGEFVKKATENGRFDLLDALAHSVKCGNFSISDMDETCINQFGDYISKIRKEDDRIQPMDVALVAHGMIDAKCRCLLTFDSNMINSTGLKKIIDASPSHGKRFQITDCPI